MLSCYKYCPLKLALLAGEIPTALFGSGVVCRVGDAFEPATSTLVMAVAAPARASVSGSYFASFFFFMGCPVMALGRWEGCLNHHADHSHTFWPRDEVVEHYTPHCVFLVKL